FGPSFAKRSLTTGKGKFSAGFNWLHAGYDSIGGFDLTNGDLVTAKNAKNFPPGLPVAAPLKLDLSSHTTVGFATCGVTNDVDVGIVVPWIRVTMGADLRYLSASNVDVTPPGLLVIPRTSASGVGDIAVFGRY